LEDYVTNLAMQKLDNRMELVTISNKATDGFKYHLKQYEEVSRYF